jgi:hypothetical protein
LATIFSLEKSRKWIIREGLTGISRNGSGAPIACGWKKSLGFFTLLLGSIGSRSPSGNLVNAPRRRSGGDRGSPPYLEWMDAGGPDTTQDWLLPERSRPPTIGELERRIEEALVTARASEAAVMTVGAAALDAAEQARHAAELAERASVAALAAGRGGVAVATASAGTGKGESGEAEGLRDFSERADRLVARLRQLQRVPLPAPSASAVSAPPRSAR